MKETEPQAHEKGGYEGLCLRVLLLSQLSTENTYYRLMWLDYKKVFGEKRNHDARGISIWVSAWMHGCYHAGHSCTS